jgi:demethylmenaquinone methyltransferase / 2-methoxy-6-polyprenyl-1,4-benzoquinol methylase
MRDEDWFTARRKARKTRRLKGAKMSASGTKIGREEGESSTAQAVRAMFADITLRYDFLNHFLSLGLDIVWRRATARALRDALGRPGSVALDACCGTGDLALALRKYSAGTVVGADFCQPMLARAQEKAAGKRPALPFLGADTLALPFADGALDLVAVAFGFRNLANYAAGLEEMRRVLKPGGVIAILEFSRVRSPSLALFFRFYFQNILPRLGGWISGNPDAYRYLPESVAKFPDQDALAAAIEKAGFVNVRYRNFSGGVAAFHWAEKA